MSIPTALKRMASTLSWGNDRFTHNNPDFPQHLQAAVGIVPDRPDADFVEHLILTGRWS